MNDQPWWIADYIGQTTINPLGFTMVLLCGCSMIGLPRRYAVWPMIVIACLVAPAQRIAIPLLNFDLLRIMVLFGWIRVLFRGETAVYSWNSLDRLFLGYVASNVAIFTLQRATFPDLMNRLGYAYDACGMYFLFRCLVRDWRDFEYMITGFTLISIPIAVVFIVENQTGRNAFAFFGGVPEITVVRDNRMRCQGAFAHPILAGCFWASLLPLMAAKLWSDQRSRILAIISSISAIVVIICCASSTPIGAAINAVMAACLYPWRRYMRVIRWCILGILVLLHLLMKAPVWHLLARVQMVGGSTAWHRYNVIDQAVRHFNEWWLLGARSTVNWGVIDITNHFILEGVRGGLLTMALLIAAIVVAFANVGRIIHAVAGNRRRTAMAWALGVSLWIHCVNFIGVSYFGQIIVIWYLLLACVASLSPLARCAVSEPDRRARSVGAVQLTVMRTVGSAASVRQSLHSPLSCDD